MGDGRLEAEGPKILYLYGSGMGLGPPSIKAIRMLFDGGYEVLCCDYRGTGHSSGRWWTSKWDGCSRASSAAIAGTARS